MEMQCQNTLYQNLHFQGTRKVPFLKQSIQYSCAPHISNHLSGWPKQGLKLCNNQEQSNRAHSFSATAAQIEHIFWETLVVYHELAREIENIALDTNGGA